MATIEADGPSDDVPPGATPWRRGFWALVGVGLVLGLAFVIATPPGAPYDEPSHFSTVQFYGNQYGMPVMGRPGVTYEAQQPPLYYAAGAMVYRGARAIGGDRTAFYALRVATLLLLVPIALGTRRLGRELLPGDTVIPAIAGGFTAVATPMLATTASVQNDSLAISLALAGLIVFLRAWRRPSAVMASAAGAVFALGVLAKTSVLPVAAACGIVLLVRRPAGWARRALTFSATVALVAGWWFVRNIVLYGDLTGIRGVALTGGPSTTVDRFTPRTTASAAYGFIATYWAPAEYYRNVFRIPLPVRLLILLMLVVAGSGLVLQVWRRRAGLRQPASVVVVASVAATLILWLAVRFTIDPISARLTYVVFGPFAIAVVVGVSAWSRRALLAPHALAAVVSGYFLVQLVQEPHRVFHLW